jgi:beta-glucanase (GH16 family)
LAGTAHLTFDDEFNNLSLWNGSSGTWASTFWYQDPNGNGGSLPSNGEQEWYINSQYGPTSGIRPWTDNNGILTITATPTPSGASGLVNNYSYVSGELNTFHSFAQTYGYFEMRAQLPKGQGFWPAFWLMPENGSWPPELDIMEMLGQNPNYLVTTSHSNVSGMQSQWNLVADMTAGYHTYGFDWEPDYLTWYFDGQPVYRIPTPADANVPMYIIANLAVGGNWPGPADGVSSAQMNIDYIRAYAPGGGSSGGGSSGGSSGSSGQTFWSDNNGDHWTGTAGNDTFYLGRGGDVVSSGGGTDTFVFKEVPWAGGHISGFGGQDVLNLAFLQTYGYTGSNPIADGRLKLVSDGQGGTQVWIDLDGLSIGSGTWLVTTLDGVSPSSLAWQNGHLVDPPAGSQGSGSSSGGGSSPPPPTGQTFTSDNAGDHWTGTAGNDVFNLGRGGDVVTGNGGADTFKFAEVPWAGGHITDFGSDDRLDLSAMFARYGYSGTDPLHDGHLSFASDGQGGTQVWFDMDGLPVGSGTWLVTTLDHVSPSSLAISGGVISEGSGSGSTASTPGQTFTSDNNGDHWTGTAGNDVFNLGRGGDVVTGNGGNDTFKFAEVPWARAEITDFGGGDQIDLSAMFQRYGYAGADPVADGRLSLTSDGQGGTQVWFKADGLSGASGTWQLFALDHVAPASLHVSGAFISG